MKYTVDQLSSLIEEVEAQGGEIIEEMCSSKTYELTGDKLKPVTLAGCGEFTLMEIPYEARNTKGDEIGFQPVRVCAVDDNVGMWPRFEDSIS